MKEELFGDFEADSGAASGDYGNFTGEGLRVERGGSHGKVRIVVVLHSIVVVSDVRHV